MGAYDSGGGLSLYSRWFYYFDNPIEFRLYNLFQLALFFSLEYNN